MKGKKRDDLAQATFVMAAIRIIDPDVPVDEIVDAMRRRRFTDAAIKAALRENGLLQ